MAKPLPEALRAPIVDLASAKVWLETLVGAGLDFHLEDDPGDIIQMGSGEAIFDPADVPLIRERVAALYAQNWPPEYDCPIGYILHLDEAREQPLYH